MTEIASKHLTAQMHREGAIFLKCVVPNSDIEDAISRLAAGIESPPEEGLEFHGTTIGGTELSYIIEPTEPEDAMADPEFVEKLDSMAHGFVEKVEGIAAESIPQDDVTLVYELEWPLHRLVNNRLLSALSVFDDANTLPPDDIYEVGGTLITAQAYGHSNEVVEYLERRRTTGEFSHAWLEEKFPWLASFITEKRLAYVDDIETLSDITVGEIGQNGPEYPTTMIYHIGRISARSDRPNLAD